MPIVFQPAVPPLDRCYPHVTVRIPAAYIGWLSQFRRELSEHAQTYGFLILQFRATFRLASDNALHPDLIKTIPEFACHGLSSTQGWAGLLWKLSPLNLPLSCQARSYYFSLNPDSGVIYLLYVIKRSARLPERLHDTRAIIAWHTWLRSRGT